MKDQTTTPAIEPKGETTLIVEKRGNSIEELLKENQELKNQLSKIPCDLDSRLEYFKRQKLNAKKLETITETLKLTDDVKQQLSETVNDLEQSDFSFVLIKGSPAHLQNVKLKISDVKVVSDITDLIIAKLNNRKQEIETEICA